MTDGIARMPGFIAGTWQLDPAHSDVGFVVGHLVVSKVHGRFHAFSGTVVTDEDLARTSVNVSIEAASVNTHLPVRDNQVRSADFLDAEHFPTSRSCRPRSARNQASTSSTATSRSAAPRVR